MATPRSGAPPQLRKLLEAAAAAYVVDAGGRIVFANSALAEWTGATVETLVGSICTYHSQPAEGDQVPASARLCPPPQALHGERSTARIEFSRVADGRIDARQVEFIPLWGKDAKVVGAIALVERAAMAHDDKVELIADEPAPADWHQLLDRVRRRAGERYSLDRLLGESSAARRIRAQVDLAGSGRGHVLVIGPAGSGRQQVARSVHQASRRKVETTLVPLACPLLGMEVLRSSLHALSKSPAGATTQGTLLLLDVDQLSSDCQAELVTVLQRADPPRVIGTARQTLTDLSRRGKFREDLALLVSTLVIELPPLVERLDDLPLLAQALLEEQNAAGSKQVGGFSPEALDRLAQYSWPGNFHELAAIVKESHDRTSGAVVNASDLPEQLDLATQAASRPRKADERIVLNEFMGQIERELIERALRRCKGNKAKAARLLGMTRPRLYRRMVQLGLAKG